MSGQFAPRRDGRGEEPRTTPHLVAALLYDGMSPFETGIVAEVFGLGRPELAGWDYQFLACSPRPGGVTALGGLRLKTPHGLDVLATADTIVVPGVTDVSANTPAAVCRALQSAHARGARLVSICSGAFALAAAGLLDGRRATTHWQYAEQLAARYPSITVDPDVLYVDEGRVLTSAGSAAGLDLCLHLLRQDHGAQLANAVARRLVVAPHRDGGQAQYIEAPVARTETQGGVAASLQWALGRLATPLSVADLARAATMSPRSYLRHFTRATGSTPARWLAQQRICASLPLLEATVLSVDQVAAAVGMDPVTFRRHFRAHRATSPQRYRQDFQQSSDRGS